MGFEDRVKQRYKAEQGRQYHQTKRRIPDVAYPWVAALRAQKIQSHVSAHDTVLEYGVGTGWNLAHLRCKRRIGFDLAEHVKPVLHEHNIEFAAETADIPAGSIDTCICHHALEHTPEPAKVLEEIGRLLRPHGKLLLFVPYEKERRYRRYDPAEPNHHLYSWNVQTLANFVTDAGFNVLDAGIGRFGYDRFAAVWAVKLKLGAFGFRWIRRVLHLIRPAYEVRIVAEKDSTSTNTGDTGGSK